MKESLSQEDIEELLRVCGTEPRLWNTHGEMMICCPVHDEVNPSMGVSSEKQLAHCFSCGFAGDFASLLFYSQPDQFKNYYEASEFIRASFNVSSSLSSKSHSVKRFEDLSFQYQRSKPKVLPLYKLAPYKSGKETYKYFFNRGFTKKDMREFMIGRDVVNRTVTIPVFNENEELLGIIGRYIDRNRKKSERYKIYDRFKRGKVLYPLNKIEVTSGVLNLVEGSFDAIRLHSLGYKNSAAKMGVNLTSHQVTWIKNHFDKVVCISDNDRRGYEALQKDIEMLKQVGVATVTVEYPNYGKDICDWEEEDIINMLDHTKHKHVKRYV